MLLNSLHFGYYYDWVRNKGKALVGRYMLVVMGGWNRAKFNTISITINCK